MRITAGASLAAVALLAAGAGTARADGAVTSPGVMFGGEARAPGGGAGYAALPLRDRTAVLRIVDGAGVGPWRTVAGTWGVPLVAFDGSADGVSADGRTLVLSEQTRGPALRRTSRFLVLHPPRLSRPETITLGGDFAFDAISPDGGTLYLIERTSARNLLRYRVRAYDVAAGRLVPGRIVDRREPDETMTGFALTRESDPGGRWAYTLIQAADGEVFIHALDTANRRAACIDLPRSLWGAARRLDVRGAGDSTLAVLDGRGRTVALVDRASLAVRRTAPGTPAPAPPAEPADGGPDPTARLVALATLAGAALAAAGVLARHRRA